jgi:nitrile hydratase beta subunit
LTSLEGRRQSGLEESMDGVHDVGGMDGLGPVGYTREEPVFDNDWERRVFVMSFPAMALGRNLDAFRHGIERMHPVDYLSTPYYAHWLHSIERGLIESGVCTVEEFQERVRRYAEDPGARVPQRSDPPAAERLAGFMRIGAPARRELDDPPAFSVGDPVLVRNLHPAGHTRLAGYLRGKRGRIEAAHGAFVFPDTNAHGLGEQPQHVYTVSFQADEVWGPDADPHVLNHFDMWEPYLVAA